MYSIVFALPVSSTPQATHPLQAKTSLCYPTGHGTSERMHPPAAILCGFMHLLGLRGEDTARRGLRRRRIALALRLLARRRARRHLSRRCHDKPGRAGPRQGGLCVVRPCWPHGADTAGRRDVRLGGLLVRPLVLHGLPLRAALL